MKLHFSCDMDGWVLERTARLLQKHIPEATISDGIDPDSDVTIYFPYYRLMEHGPGVDIALFTHREIADDPSSAFKRNAFDKAALLADVCLAMSKQTAKHLPASKTALFNLPADPAFIRETPVFGIVGRQYQSGRKRLDWVTGLPGRWIYSGGEVEYDKMPEFYAACDYIVIVSDNEGGPLPVKEAIMAGKPVIAPNVGWAWDYPVIRYEGVEGLRDVVLKLMPKDETKDAARQLYSAAWYAFKKEAA